ncbi:P-loop NTPase fold protein [Neobacillus sp. FSL H8-0543]|uniref:P-loop NTPase fold protein n=1 Tax=Neobacillus sp. FSL H8-0543 TaxID=2954672 RepID=UPI0031590314
MKRWNTEIYDFLENITEVLFKGFKEGSSIIFEFVNTYNSLLAILILILVGFFYFKKVIDKEEKEFTLLKVCEIILNILIAAGLGYLVKLANIEGLIKILNLVWSVSVGLTIFFLLLLLREIVIYIKSSNKIVAGYSNGYIFLGLIYLFTSIASNQFEPINIILMVIYFLSLWMFVQLISQNSKKADIGIDEESDNPINTYSQLLPTRKKEFNRVYNQLTNVRYNEPFAITINGDWGEGKTSFVNVLSNKLEENDNYIIFIQPMILDTSQKQMDYLFKQLKSILNKSGIYTGKGSPFKQYFKLITSVLNAKPLMQLEGVFSVIDDEELPSDFRTNKQLLEEDIQRLLRTNKDISEKKKIYIIVDDFDRVEKETMYNTLVFIKELVHFKGVNVIFLMDEQKLEAVKENKINKEYLDKFVNNKIQMSKIESREIFDYFLNNIKEEDFKSDFIKNILKDLKDKVNNRIEQVQLMTKEKIAELEKTIEDLTSSNGKQKQYKEEDNKSERYEELQTQKHQLISSFNRFKSGVTNLRKAKKVVREIKEILIICDEQNNNRNYQYFVNNMKKGKIDEKIANLAILKILFSEFVDEIIKKNDTRDFIYESNVDFLKIMFEDLGYPSYTEDKELIANIVNLFCNSILLNKPFEKELFSELRTNSAEILNKLDSPAVLNISNNHIKVIQEYLRAIKFNSSVVPNKIVLKRLDKLIEYIFVLYDEEVLSLKNLFELISKPQRNPLIDHSLYFEKIKNILQQEKKFESENDKNASLYNLDKIEPHLLSQYKGDIIMFISLLKLKEGSFTYENFVADLGGIIRLDEMIKEIKNTFKENDNNLIGIEFLADWAERALSKINADYSGNRYILDSTKKYKILIDKFIKTYGLWAEVKFKVKNLSVNHQSKFNEKIAVNSLQELEFDINEFYEYINKGNRVEPYLYYFNSILLHLEKYTRVNKIKEDIIQTVEDIYQKLNSEDLNEIAADTEQLLLWCTVNLGEIKENLKKAENMN